MRGENRSGRWSWSFWRCRGTRAGLGCYCSELNFVGFLCRAPGARAFLRGDIFYDGVFVGVVFVDDGKPCRSRVRNKKQNQFRSKPLASTPSAISGVSRSLGSGVRSTTRKTILCRSRKKAPGFLHCKARTSFTCGGPCVWRSKFLRIDLPISLLSSI